MNQPMDTLAKPGQYLSFSLGQEDFAIPLGSVFEINGLTAITSVPQTPDFIAGVINLRGKIIPVVNLRVKLGMGAIAHTKETCVIIADAGGRHVGMIVDSVKEVLDLHADKIAPKPQMGGEEHASFITGMAKIEGRVTIMMDTNSVLSFADLQELGNVTAKAS